MQLKKIPNHIAFIVDGNGRWAKKRGLPRKIGHKYGVEAVKEIIKACLEYKIKFASFYVFSTENFKRSKEEIENIFDLLQKYIDENLEDFVKSNLKLMISGDISKLPKDLQKSLINCIERTKENDELVINMCLNYGGQQELAYAFNNMIKDNIKDATPEIIKQYLYTKNLPPVDFVIRTSGEQRISNFLLFDLAYSELYFTKTYWPDFNKKKLEKALKSYQNRDRRFGKA